MGLLKLLGALRDGLCRVLSSFVPGLGKKQRRPASSGRTRISRERVAMSAAAGNSSPPKKAGSKLEEQATAKADLSYSYWAKPDVPANTAEPPKKLTPEEAAAAAAAHAARTSSGAAASAWNQAGTFEEKAVTDWAKQQLKTRLVGLSSSSVRTTAVNSIDGDAHVWFVRGKKRHGFDFNISISWEVGSSGSSRDIKGTVKVPSASPDDLDDLHLEVELTGSSSAGGDAAQQAVRDAKRLKEALEEALQQFYSDMKAL